jgi:hypothetical protein
MPTSQVLWIQNPLKQKPLQITVEDSPPFTLDPGCALAAEAKHHIKVEWLPDSQALIFLQAHS